MQQRIKKDGTVADSSIATTEGLRRELRALKIHVDQASRKAQAMADSGVRNQSRPAESFRGVTPKRVDVLDRAAIRRASTWSCRLADAGR